MGAENRSGQREFQLRAGAGFCVIKGSGCENRKGKVVGYGILILIYETATQRQNECACSTFSRASRHFLVSGYDQKAIITEKVPVLCSL